MTRFLWISAVQKEFGNYFFRTINRGVNYSMTIRVLSIFVAISLATTNAFSHAKSQTASLHGPAGEKTIAASAFVDSTPSKNLRNNVAGVYLGYVFSGDDMDPVTTEIKLDADNRLRGTYVIEEESCQTAGELSGFVWESEHALICNWEDKYGVGHLRILFSTQFDAFTGFWGVNRDSLSSPWDGRKQEWRDRYIAPGTSSQ